jgi:hypothetical protein
MFVIEIFGANIHFEFKVNASFWFLTLQLQDRNHFFL